MSSNPFAPCIKDILCTGESCPEQYQGSLTDGRMFYVRCRNGKMSISISANPTCNPDDAITGIDIFEATYQGCLLFGTDLVTTLVKHAVLSRFYDIEFEEKVKQFCGDQNA
jgi:hypothetical protein